MLEPEEKVAGRLFRDIAQAQLAVSLSTDPPTYTVPVVLGLYRHKCTARGGVSTALELREVYTASPAIVVESDDGNLRAVWHDTWNPCRASTVDTWIVPAGRFGFVTRYGRCRGCGQTARSPLGRLVDGWRRPPIDGCTEELIVMTDCTPTDDEQDHPGNDDREPARSQSQPGYTYENPNEDETYVPPNEDDQQ